MYASLGETKMTNNNEVNVTPASERKLSIINNYVVTVAKYINEKIDKKDSIFSPFETYTLSLDEMQSLLHLVRGHEQHWMTDKIFNILAEIFDKYGYTVNIELDDEFVEATEDDAFIGGYIKDFWCASLTISIPKLVL